MAFVIPRIFCSWSGGKDSCLALHRALEQGAVPSYLLTMFAVEGGLSRSHGLKPRVIEAQAKSLGIPLLTGQTSWHNYEEVFLGLLAKMHEGAVHAGVFGDIDIPEHIEWVEKVCRGAGLEPWLPLAGGERTQLVKEFVELGYRALIVSARENLRDLLGRQLDRYLLEEMAQRQIDPCGEQGEFHTVAVDGPIFSRPVQLKRGKVCLRNGYAFLDYDLWEGSS